MLEPIPFRAGVRVPAQAGVRVPVLNGESGVPRLDQRRFHDGDATERAAFAAELRQGLEATGFAVIERHGVDAVTIRAAYAALEVFFALDEGTKQRSGGSPGGQRGYTGFGIEHAKDQLTPDLKEFFHVGREWASEHPRRGATPANLWPSEVPALRTVLSGLYEQLERCAEQLLEALSLAYGVAPRTFPDLLREGNSILRAAHYPALPAGAPPGALRAAPHEDINLITLLCEATDAGLEILTPAGWQAIETAPGQIVVDAGDMLRQVTGGVIPSTTHRVVNPEPGSPASRRARTSLPFFAHPAPECDLSVHPHFATPERIVDHPPITAAAFLDRRLREIGLARD